MWKYPNFEFYVLKLFYFGLLTLDDRLKSFTVINNTYRMEV